MSRQPTPIPIELLAHLKEALIRLPPKPPANLTRRETVAQLETEIRAALALGYSLNDIAGIFTAAGAAVQPDTIGNALRTLRPREAPKGRAVKRARTADKAESNPRVSHHQPEKSLPTGAPQHPTAPAAPPPAAELPRLSSLRFRPLSDDDLDSEAAAPQTNRNPNGARG